MVNQGIHVMSVTVRRSYVKPLGTVGRILGIGKEDGKRILGRLGRTLLDEHEKLFGIS